jgi:hypothetical protein
MSIKNTEKKILNVYLIFLFVTLISGFSYAQEEIKMVSNTYNETHFNFVLSDGTNFTALSEGYPQRFRLRYLFPDKFSSTNNNMASTRNAHIIKDFATYQIINTPDPKGSSSIGHFSSMTKGNYSTAIGYGVIPYSYAGTAIGKYNELIGTPVPWIFNGSHPELFIDTDPIFQVGVGKDNEHRKDAITVLNNGNVGINKSNPQTTLDVVGDIKSTGTICDVNGCIGGGDSQGDTKLPLPTTNIDGKLYINFSKGIELNGNYLRKDVLKTDYNSIDQDILSLYPAGSSGWDGVELKISSMKKFIFSNGKVGIGINNPTKELEVNGDILALGKICDVNGCIGDENPQLKYSSEDIEDLEKDIEYLRNEIKLLKDELKENKKTNKSNKKETIEIIEIKSEVINLNEKDNNVESISLNKEKGFVEKFFNF